MDPTHIYMQYIYKVLTIKVYVYDNLYTDPPFKKKTF